VVVLDSGRCKIRFPLAKFLLAPNLSWPPYSAESVWGEWTGPNTARVLNNPFYIKGVGYLDIVRVKNCELAEHQDENDANPKFVEFDSVVSRSGYGIVRAILAVDEGRDLAEQALKDVEALGCTWESTGPVVSIDIPPEVNQDAVISRLEAAAARKAIHVDVG
jgi:hypothetical protein